MKLNSVAGDLTSSLGGSTAICVVAALGFASVLGWALAAERWWTVAVIAVAASLPIVARWPVIVTFGLYAFIVPFDTVAWISQQGDATLTRLIGMAAAAALLAAALIERRLTRPPAAALWFGALVIWALLSAVWAVDGQAVLRRMPTALSLYCLYLVAVSMRVSRKELYAVGVLVIAGGVIAAGLGYTYGVEAPSLTGGRGAVALGNRVANPNSLGAALILPAALVFAAFVESRTKMGKLLAAGALGCIGIGVYITMSRGALAAFIVTIMVFVYRSHVRSQVVVAIALLLVLVLAMPETFFARISEVLTGESTGSGRIEIWKVGIVLLDRFWVFGAGFSNFNDLYGDEVLRRGRGAHNTYLSTWVELGIVGFALFLIAIGSHFAGLRRAGRATSSRALLAACEAACYGTLIAAFFGDYLWTKHFWLPWILLIWGSRNAVVSPDTSGGDVLLAEESKAMRSRPERPGA